ARLLWLLGAGRLFRSERKSDDARSSRFVLVKSRGQCSSSRIVCDRRTRSRRSVDKPVGGDVQYDTTPLLTSEECNAKVDPSRVAYGAIGTGAGDGASIPAQRDGRDHGALA